MKKHSIITISLIALALVAAGFAYRSGVFKSRTPENLSSPPPSTEQVTYAEGDPPISKQSSRQVVGFYTLPEPSMPGSYKSFAEHIDRMSEVGLFMFRINKENPWQIDKFGEFTDADVNFLVSYAHSHNVAILPIVHNLLYGNTTVGKNAVKKLVNSPENRRAFVKNLISLIDKYNFDGVNIDIEDVYLEDSGALSTLYKEISSAVHARGKYLAVSTPSRVSDKPISTFGDPFDYGVIGSVADRVILMLYNEHGWPGSGPGPVVSDSWMRKVIGYASTKMPLSKVTAAVSVFGFDFDLNTGKVKYASFDSAMALAKKMNKQIIFDQESKTPMFRYVDADGHSHEVWFENADSIKAKMDTSVELGVNGIALWRLGLEDPAMWEKIK